MKTALITIFFLAVVVTSKAQTKIDLTDISKHIGDSVLVKGKVFGSRAVSNGKLFLINLGGAYPNQLLTVVLEENIQQVLAEPLKAELQELSIAGRVEVFKTKPQIVVKNPAQIHGIITEKAGARE